MLIWVMFQQYLPVKICWVSFQGWDQSILYRVQTYQQHPPGGNYGKCKEMLHPATVLLPKT